MGLGQNQLGTLGTAVVKLCKCYLLLIYKILGNAKFVFILNNLVITKVKPVYFSEPLVHYCVPKDLVSLSFDVKNDIIQYLNTKDIFHKVLSDLIHSWKEMIILCFVALGSRLIHKSVALYMLMFCL